MPTRNHWPLMVIVLVGGFLAMTAWSFHRAATGASAVTDRDYYSHGLRYDQTMLEQKTAAVLGWETEPRLHGRLVTIELRDRAHLAVTGALGSLILLDASKRTPREIALSESEPGSYQAELPVDTFGEQPAEITFQRDGARLSQRILLSLN